MNKGTTMHDWAEREVELVISSLKKSIKEDDDFKYSKSVYYDALKVFKLLMKQGHSGYSYGAVCLILKKFMAGLPLSPITDNDEEWNHCGFLSIHDVKSVFQNIRRLSLFKEVYKDGIVKYTDNDRIVCIDDETSESYGARAIMDVVDEMFPIEMPYEPSTKKYIVHTNRVEKNNDIGFEVFYVETPEGNIADINKFFDRHDCTIKEITENEFCKKYGKAVKDE